MNLKIKNSIPYLLTLIILVGVFVLVPVKKAGAQTASGCYGANGQSVAFDQITCIGLASQGYTWKSTSSTPASGTTGTGTPVATPAPSTPATSGTSTLAPGDVWCDYGPDGNGGESIGTESPTATQTAAQVCQASQGTVTSTPPSSSTSSTSSTSASTTPANSSFQNSINANFVCSIVPGNFNLTGCLGQLMYWLLMVIPAYILWLAAYFFNVFVYVTLSGKLFAGSTFIPAAWAVVRDLSNIFFILILLYIAIQLILGLGGHGVKQMIGKVIIIALLINFSMFFTEVIIDASNILALVFYNKINVGVIGPDGKTPILAPYENATGEKDVAGGLTGAFNPANQLTPAFFASASKTNYIPSATGTSNPTPSNPTPISSGILYGIMLLSGAVMLMASYAFFVTGFSFLGRMIELFVLIIFSPFAFMSFTVPKLASIDSIGWDSWLKRLLTASFMAPIFMFFMYFIFMLIGANLFGGLITKASPPSFIENVLGIFLPATLIVVLLLQATSYAKKGSGKFGEMVMKGAQMVGGVALGVATGGTAMLASNTLGRIGRNMANNEEVKARAAAGDKSAQRRLAVANSLAKNSFDVRQTGLGKFAAKKSGMDFDKGLSVIGMNTDKLKGGRKERDKETTKKLDETRKTYMMSKNQAEKQDIKAAEAKTQQKQNEKAAEAQNAKADQYDSAKNSAKIKADNDHISFDEKAFKEAYEKEHGRVERIIAEQVPKVLTSKETNGERQKAYALSLENPTKKIEDGKAVRRSFGEFFREGAKLQTMSASGLATTVLTGGLAMPIRGLTHAIKEMTKDKMLDSENKFTHGIASFAFTTHPEIVANVREGVVPDIQEALHHLNEAAGLKHEDHGDKHEKENTGGEHPKATDATHTASAPHPIPNNSSASGDAGHGG